MSLCRSSSKSTGIDNGIIPAAPKKIRKLGFNETYQLTRYTLNQKRGTSVACRYQIPKSLTGHDGNTKLANAIHGAIGRVIYRAPLLQVGYSGENTTKPFWIQLGSVNLQEHVIWTTLNDSANNDQAIQATIASYINIKFPDIDKRPGFRVVIMQHTEKDFLDILVVFNHRHGDGMSAKIFHHFLLAELNKPVGDDQQNLTLTFEDSSKNFPPPTEKVADLSLSLGLILKEAWDEYKPGASLATKPTDAKWPRSVPSRTRHNSKCSRFTRTHFPKSYRPVATTIPP